MEITHHHPALLLPIPERAEQLSNLSRTCLAALHQDTSHPRYRRIDRPVLHTR